MNTFFLKELSRDCSSSLRGEVRSGAATNPLQSALADCHGRNELLALATFLSRCHAKPVEELSLMSLLSFVFFRNKKAATVSGAAFCFSIGLLVGRPTTAEECFLKNNKLFIVSVFWF